jgi:hypothetical protein
VKGWLFFLHPHRGFAAVKAVPKMTGSGGSKSADAEQLAFI